MVSAIIKRTITIIVVAPCVLYLITNPITFSILVFLLTFVAMIEWTALKRHLKVELLLNTHHKSQTATPDKRAARGDGSGAGKQQQHEECDEYPAPVAKTNLFIVCKCLASSLVTVGAMISPDMFHLAMKLYFLFWVLFTLLGKNRAEMTTSAARKKISKVDGLPLSSSSTCMSVAAFHAAELTVIAERFTTELFLSFCLEYFGLVWISGMSYSILLYNVPRYGTVLVPVVLVTNWCNDIAALIVGKLCATFGRTHQLYPQLSPKKSVEGAVAGVLMNGITASLLIAYFGEDLHFGVSPDMTSYFTFFLGTIFGIFGVIGDLLQSLFKRSARLKDTGNVFPGHGGVLDRVDGLLIVYPAAYWLLWIFLNSEWAS